MSDNVELTVEVRPRTGKGGAREARRNGLVPGVLYGGGEDPVAITLKKNELQKAFNTGKFRGNTVTLVHNGEKQLVIPQDIQFHPVTDQALHVDLYRVKANQIISVEVPVRFVGEDVAPGLKKGGTLNVVRFTVELNVAANAIPEALEADVSALEIGDNVKISDITMPEGAEPTIGDRDFTIATIAGRAAEVETAVEAEEGEEGEEAEGGEDAGSEDGGEE
ncbi:MAG: 50S ribosomal protein L25/general stress protein Ctc [Pseudomonadota bacterium]